MTELDKLLGKAETVYENEKTAEKIKGQVCMVTGGGGSIGSELCRLIAKHNPKLLIIADIYENSAYELSCELDCETTVQIASVRDYSKMQSLFERFSPQLVFHAAAHKHVPLMEENPEEAVKNNIFGTLNTAQLAGLYGVKSFALISTDKAVSPVSAMGMTKKCCEMLMRVMNGRFPKTAFFSVRFGNVLGSRGSVVPIFKRRIENGGPIKITDKEMSRYFMSISEAASFTLRCVSEANGGEIFVPDMGEPIKIIDLAQRMIDISKKDIKIEITGLRSGEKLHESLASPEETLTVWDKGIFSVHQTEFDEQEFMSGLLELKEYADSNEKDAVLKKLKEII